MRSRQRERETGLEPATNSLEGCDSSQLSYSRILKSFLVRTYLINFGLKFRDEDSVVGGEGFEPPKASANGFTVRPGSPTPASAQNYKRATNIFVFKIKCKSKRRGFVSIFWINAINVCFRKFYLGIVGSEYKSNKNLAEIHHESRIGNCRD